MILDTDISKNYYWIGLWCASLACLEKCKCNFMLNLLKYSPLFTLTTNFKKIYGFGWVVQQVKHKRWAFVTEKKTTNDCCYLWKQCFNKEIASSCWLSFWSITNDSPISKNCYKIVHFIPVFASKSQGKWSYTQMKTETWWNPIKLNIKIKQLEGKPSSIFNVIRLLTLKMNSF